MDRDGSVRRTTDNLDSGGNHSVSLHHKVDAWPTPRTVSGGGESGQRKKELGREDSGGGDIQASAEASPPAQATSTDGDGSPCPIRAFYLRFPQKRRLNWRFVEWLMGFPEGWLD